MKVGGQAHPDHSDGARLRSKQARKVELDYEQRHAI